MTARELEEYKALRATIRERGTARVWIAWAGLVAWAALTVTTVGLWPVPVAALVPLLALCAAFEIVLALHTGVERIGRYVQVFFEETEDEEEKDTKTDELDRRARMWETTIMALGAQAPTGASDALLTGVFATAVVLNLVPVLLAEPTPVEWIVLGTLHGLVVVRIVLARRRAAGQRRVDLDAFRKLKSLK